MRNDDIKRTRAPFPPWWLALTAILVLGLAPLSDAGQPVKIRQRVGLREGSPHGVPLSEQIAVTITGGVAVSGDTLYAATGTTIQLGAASSPGGCEAFIQWQAPGGSPQFGTGAAFQTFFTTPGLRIIRATCGAVTDSVKVLAYRVTVSELAFDWTPGDGGDGVDIRKNRTTDVLKPEWRPGTRNEPVAYLRGKQPRVRAKFTVEPPTITRLNLSAEMPAPWLGFPERVVNFVAGASVPDTLSFQLTGQTPGAVSRDTLAVSWMGSEPNGLVSDPVVVATSGPHPLYTLLASPKAPMTEPWTEILWYACDYARGSLSEQDVVRTITLGVYWNSNIIYNPAYYYSTGYSTMNVTQFLYDQAHSPFIYVDCRDCSHWCHLQSNALGLSGIYNTLGPGFTTNFVRDMGRDYWHQWTFNFHQVAFFWSTMVADMAAAGDGDGDPLHAPHTESISKGDITMPNYLDILTEDSWVHTIGSGLCNPF